MYSRQQASQLKQEFWRTFGQYMAPVPSAEGEKINWINYKTGEKHIHFSMDAGSDLATIEIQIAHPDPELQRLFFNQFQQLRIVFENVVQESWQWILHDVNEAGKVTSRIYTEQRQANVFDKQTWPVLISFFKPRIIALDEFWSGAKYAFEQLR